MTLRKYLVSRVQMRLHNTKSQVFYLAIMIQTIYLLNFRETAQRFIFGDIKVPERLAL